jgi:hypothetical protein
LTTVNVYVLFESSWIIQVSLEVGAEDQFVDLLKSESPVPPVLPIPFHVTWVALASLHTNINADNNSKCPMFFKQNLVLVLINDRNPFIEYILSIKYQQHRLS